MAVIKLAGEYSSGTLDKTVESQNYCTGEFTYEGQFVELRANFKG